MSLFKKKPQYLKPWCPPNTRVYCIGDIHGCVDLLKVLHTDILNHASDFSGTKKLVYVGDYIDRGLYSKEVIDLLLDRPLPGFEHIFLRGNHEQSMLDFLEDPIPTRGWLNYGGLDTIVSYGVRLSGLPRSHEEILVLRDELAENIPDRHLEFINNTQYSFTEGNYCFVHAGIVPGIPLDKQQPPDLMWIRNKFISSKRPHEKIIVHGHTVIKDVEVMPNRIGIDTGAYATGKLSCLILEDDSQLVLQTSRD